MRLNIAWDFFFSALFSTGVLWYFFEVPDGHGVSRIRQFSYYLGNLMAIILLAGPIAHLAISKFQFHMVQHISLMMLISPLIVLGSPVKILVNSRNLGNNLFFKQLFRPEVGFIIFLSVLILTHFSPLANAGMLNSNVHELELILFIVGGIIYYIPLLEGNPKPFAMMLPETMVGFFLYSGNHVLHKLPQSTSKESGLLQQHTGGAIMWALGMLIDAGWIALSAAEWIKAEKRAVGDE